MQELKKTNFLYLVVGVDMTVSDTMVDKHSKFKLKITDVEVWQRFSFPLSSDNNHKDESM